MKIFGLTPDAVLARSGPVGLTPPPSLGFSLGFGGLGFALTSVAAYAIWAFQWIAGTAAMYTAIAVVLIGFTGPVLSRLVAGRGALGRFSVLFALAFAGYAVVWCVFWFGLRGKHHADLYGSAVGLALMTGLLLRAFGRADGFLAAFGVLFSLHTLGYYLGGEAHAAVPGPVGNLLWGAAYGAGFGAGLGFVVHEAQAPLRTRAAGARPAPQV